MSLFRRCSRCGFCCHVRIEDEIVKCKFLVNHGKGRTSCRKYSQRVGTLITEVGKQGFRCFLRDDVHANFPGCTMNKKEWGEEVESTPSQTK